ncbi:hypothetical protein M408DRAFT_128246 [Serendipita vermifera MAFF 305830]|uniref:Uncharacterized protein n=1 Tax=Serendipita vermifera MAFF 305830 TaxID=933852 RepID=A0A0C3BAJ7_SERVB|nr:hypothetical protein M408DRAFT_128246 [Serendipita vermifera MAFF 305830]
MAARLIPKVAPPPRPCQVPRPQRRRRHSFPSVPVPVLRFKLRSPPPLQALRALRLLLAQRRRNRHQQRIPRWPSPHPLSLSRDRSLYLIVNKLSCPGREALVPSRSRPFLPV